MTDERGVAADAVSHAPRGETVLPSAAPIRPASISNAGDLDPPFYAAPVTHEGATRAGGELPAATGLALRIDVAYAGPTPLRRAGQLATAGMAAAVVAVITATFAPPPGAELLETSALDAASADHAEQVAQPYPLSTKRPLGAEGGRVTADLPRNRRSDEPATDRMRPDAQASPRQNRGGERPLAAAQSPSQQAPGGLPTSPPLADAPTAPEPPAPSNPRPSNPQPSNPQPSNPPPGSTPPSGSPAPAPPEPSGAPTTDPDGSPGTGEPRPTPTPTATSEAPSEPQPTRPPAEPTPPPAQPTPPPAQPTPPPAEPRPTPTPTQTPAEPPPVVVVEPTVREYTAPTGLLAKVLGSLGGALDKLLDGLLETQVAATYHLEVRGTPHATVVVSNGLLRTKTIQLGAEGTARFDWDHTVELLKIGEPTFTVR